MVRVNATVQGYAKALRKTKNPWEAKLWYHLPAGRFYGFKFKRQVPVGGFIVDFCCHEKRLAIEVDGSQHQQQYQQQQDQAKSEYLQKAGYAVLHFWNSDIGTNIEGVLEIIRRAINK